MDMNEVDFLMRRVCIFGSISDTHDKVEELVYLNSVGNKVITLVISSPGGYVSEGLAIINTIKSIKSPVYSIITDEASSMGALIAMSCDVRLAYPDAEIMLHSASGGSSGSALEQEEDLVRMKKSQDGLTNIILSETRITKTMLNKNTRRRDWYMNTAKALELGVIDEVIRPCKPLKRRFK